MSDNTIRSFAQDVSVAVDPNRWRPKRAGLLNVWQYTDEILEFERGRMVLFGPNGSGKTMALELLLPHLLDAKGQPIRLSTSGIDRGGLWDRVTGYDDGEARTGYLWVEFCRGDDATFTVGVRLRAKPSGGGDKTWFTTTRRIGFDLSLLDDNRRPLSVEQLRDALEQNGKVWGSDTSGYRHAVRTALFPGWSEDRLDAVIRSLLVVRKQNVSEGLSVRKLSDLLSEALPPLDDLELGRVADGFADLDRRRDHISQLKNDVAATDRLSQTNRTYARAVTARVVGDVVNATTNFDNVARDLRKLTTELEAARELQGELDKREDKLERETESLAGEKQGLERSDAYKKGAKLTDLREAAELAGSLANEADRRAQEERKRAETRREKANEAQNRADLAVQQTTRARCELGNAVATHGGPLSDDVADDSVWSLLRAWLDERLQAIRAVREKLHELQNAKVRRDEASRHKNKSEGCLAEAEEDLRKANKRLELAERDWRKAVAEWRIDARELRPFLGTLDEPSEAAQVVGSARSQAREPLIKEVQSTSDKVADLENTLGTIEDELREYREGREPEPDAPVGRRDRADSQGAPLWRLLSFRDTTPGEVRNAVESALADSRLLDAWLSPDGSISLGDNDIDVILLEAPLAGGSSSDSLADVLELDPEAIGADGTMVKAILSAIPLVVGAAHSAEIPDGGLVLGRDGTWRTPWLAGRANVESAQYIGASSRESARLARIAALERDILDLKKSRETLTTQLADLKGRLERCDQEHQAFPSTDEFKQAERSVGNERVLVEAQKRALHDATQRLLKADGQVKDCLNTLMQTATKHDLPTEPDRLDEVDAAMEGVRSCLDAFRQRLEAQISAIREMEKEGEFAAEAEAVAGRGERDAAERQREHRHAAARFSAIEKAIGADYREVMDHIARITARQAEIRAERKDLRDEKSVLDKETGRLENALEQTELRRRDADHARTNANEEFVTLCRDGMARDADLEADPLVEVLGSVTAILEAARELRASPNLGTVPDEAARTKLHNRVMERLHAASQQLAGRVDLTFEPEDRDWAVLRARREGVVTSATQLRNSLKEDMHAAEAELTEKERELFEEILTGSIREHLKDRLWSAQELVDRVNALLGQVKSASGGVSVKLHWEIDPELAEAAELRKAKELLLHDSPIASGRIELDMFLRSRIERVRADESDTGDWRDRLTRMLDYRSWHRFQVLVHHKRFGDRPRPLANRNVSLSTGEKTIVMVLPLLAAVTAHYEPAAGAPPCVSPRLLLMDELFPKLDVENKRQLIGLLPTLDLDAVFTSDKDRCEYDTLDGIAIHVFQKLGNDKTTTTRLVWNGSQTVVAMPDVPVPNTDQDGQSTLLPLE